MAALRDVSLRIEEGEAVAVVGLSGSGKTTLLRCILGLEEADRGRVLLAGRPCGDDRSGRVRAVFQDSLAAMNPRLSIAGIIGESLILAGLSDRRQRRVRIGHAVQAVFLPEEALSRRPSELSAGQRQRAAIARAIVTEPDLLLADEPTSALDPALGRRILLLLSELHRRGSFAHLMVTHDLWAAAACCSRVVVMHEGSIVERGTVREVFNRPRAVETRELVRAARLNAGLDGASRE